MQIRNIDLNGNRFLIARNTTKTDAGDRDVEMSPEAREAAERLLARARKMGSYLPEHVLFPGFASRFGPRTPDPSKPLTSFGYAWHRLRKVLTINPDLRLHDFRHNFTTDLAETNTSSAAACKVMGWGSPIMRQRYEHLKDRLQNVAKEAVKKVIEIRQQRSAGKPKPPVQEPIRIQLRRKMAS